VVELFRRTIQGVLSESEPDKGPFLFGAVNWGYTAGRGGRLVSFYGWRGNSVILCRTAKNPWLGIIIPESSSEALVRQSFFEEIEPDLLLDILSALEGRFGKISGCSNEEIWRDLTQAAGLTAGFLTPLSGSDSG
ncbi:hypothetical protein MYX84_03560, partial [Acidobacteria bacterium AH-259-O06]|nr:hypothetical protein [Acidobacteria bacterium AH-259-O06]